MKYIIGGTVAILMLFLALLTVFLVCAAFIALFEAKFIAMAAGIVGAILSLAAMGFIVDKSRPYV